MKNQALFSSKDKSIKIKFCLLQYLFGALRVNCRNVKHSHFIESAFSVFDENLYILSDSA